MRCLLVAVPHAHWLDMVAHAVRPLNRKTYTGVLRPQVLVLSR